MPFKNVLVPVDYSEPSRRALELAISLDGAARITVVHAWDRPSYVADEQVVHLDGTRRSLIELIRENAEREMGEFLQRAALGSSQVEHRLLSGEPVTVIVEEASKHGYDLMVVGTNGRTGVSRLLLGSVTEKLIRLSPIPVLSVPPPH